MAIPSPVKTIAHREGRTCVPPPAEGTLLWVNASVADSTRMGLDVKGLAYFDDEDGTPFYPGDLDDLPEPPLTALCIANTPDPGALEESVDQGESATEQ